MQKFQQPGQALSSATTALVEINHDEKLAAQTLEQCLQHYQDKQAENRRKTEEKLALSTERDALLPRSGSETKLSADSYEQSINQTVLAARDAHQQASNKSRNWQRNWQVFNNSNSIGRLRAAADKAIWKKP